MEDRLEVCTLGTLVIRYNGVLVDSFVTRKAESLLVYLACTGRPHAREVLSEMLWEERTQSQALANLRVILTNLRKTVAPYVEIRRRSVAINPASDIWVDTIEFETVTLYDGELTASSAKKLEHVLSLYQGDFLEGHFVDSGQLQDWITLEQERLRLLALGAIDRLVDYYTRVKDYSAGIRWAARSLQVDNLREETYRQLMILLAKSGQRHAALMHYETCCNVLREELGVEPSSETVNLSVSIQSGEFADEQSPISGSSEVIPGALVREIDDMPGRSRPPDRLVGRDALLGQIDSLLAKNERVLLQGFAGAGKTALAASVVARRLAADHHPIVWLQVGNENADAVVDRLLRCL